MTHSLPPSIPDPVDRLSEMLDDYTATPETDNQIVTLAQAIIDKITLPGEDSIKLLARAEIMIKPKMHKVQPDGEPASDGILTIFDDLFQTFKDAKTSADADSYRKENIKARLERHAKDPSFKDPSLFANAESLYLLHKLKDKSDLSIIEYLITNEEFKLYSRFQEFIETLSHETTYPTLSFIRKKFPHLFDIYFVLICKKFLIPQPDSPDFILDKNQLIDLLLSQPSARSSMTLLTNDLAINSLGVSTSDTDIIFDAFLSDSRTRESFTEVIIAEIDSILMKLEITPSKLHFLCLAIALVPDKVNAFSKIETLKALHPKLAKLPQFIDLEKKVKAEKILELELDPIKKDIDQHSGELWRCVGRQSVALLSGEEGYIYEFILKPEYSNVSLMNTRLKEIYPATESTPQDLPQMFGDTSELRPDSVFQSFLNRLGYTFTKSSNRVTFPDRKTLLDRYNQFRAAHPEKSFPELSIISSLGIAEDLEFVNALIMHHGMISDGKEFIHDHIAHILVILLRALQNPSTFSKTQAEMKEYYQLQLTRITTLEEVLKKGASALFTPEDRQDLLKYLPIFQTLLGACVDTISSRTEFGEITLSNILSDSEWESYLRTRYSRAAHDAAKEPKPPIFDDAALKRIRELLPLIIEKIG